jgi:hypothetical protein
MSWLFSQALVEEYLGDIFLDGEQSVQLNGNNIQQAYCAPDKMTDFCRVSQFGMMFKPLTENLGEELLMSYLGDFHVKTSALLEKELELKESDQECGKKWQESLAKLDQNTLLWKIPQCSLLEDLAQSLEIWPKWGSMRSGECYPQPMLERTTKESEFGYWLTPTATAISGRSQKAMEYRTKQRESQGHNTVQPGNLAEQVIYSGKIPCKDMKNPTWPTPVSSPSVTSQTVGATLDLMNSRERGQGTLMEAVVKRMFPTPQASDNRDRENMSNPSIQRRIAKGKQIMLSQSVDQNSGQLNPPWVEWLMGWPLGWTDLKPLETDKSHFVQQQLGDC